MPQSTTLNRKIADHPYLFDTLNETLTPKDTTAFFADKGIVDVRQLYGLLLVENVKGSKQINKMLGAGGVDRLTERLELLLSSEEKRELKNVVPSKYHFGLLVEERNFLIRESVEGFEFGIKAVLDGATTKNKEILQSAVKELLSKKSAAEIAEEGRCTFNSFFHVKDQGSRETCASFAFTYANEYFQFVRKQQSGGLDGGHTPLSQQYLHLQAKLIEGNVDCGTRLTYIVQALTVSGQAECNHMPYISVAVCSDNGLKNLLSDSYAAKFKAPCIQLNPSDTNIFKAAILCEGVVVCALPFFESWVDNPDSRRTGIITMPLDDDKVISGHAMAIIGFEPDITMPGGGCFIAKNSWGTSWALESSFYPGYARVPYKYIEEYCFDAYTIIYA